MIDELTSEFTLAAIICDYCIDVKNRKERYQKGKFVMECIDAFELTQQGYSVSAKVTKYDKNSRYGSIKEFCEEYMQALKEGDGYEWK